MSSKKSVLLSGALAAVIAVALIAATLTAGVLTSSQKTTGNLLPSTVTSGGVSTSTSSKESISSPGATLASSGTLAVLMTDPPTVPYGVTHVYINYSNLEIHISGAGNESGWTQLGSQGTIDLMSIINVTQTIASANITTGVFNAIVFNVTSATVTFQGVNYTANLVYKEHILSAYIPGGVSVIGGQTSVAVIDLTPTVLLLGTPSNPTFAFIPEARAYAIPAQSMPAQSLHNVGERESVEGKSWWQNIQQNYHFEIAGIALTPDTLSLTIRNIGNSPVVFKEAALTSTVSTQGGEKENRFAAVASISEIFVMEPNATFAALTSYNSSLTVLVAGAGYVLPPQASVTFTYSGNITIGVLRPYLSEVESALPLMHVVPGQNYVVTVRTEGGLVAQGYANATQ